mgnify:CR=1 FL=1
MNNEVFDIFKLFQSIIQTQFSTSIKILWFNMVVSMIVNHFGIFPILMALYMEHLALRSHNSMELWRKKLTHVRNRAYFVDWGKYSMLIFDSCSRHSCMFVEEIAFKNYRLLDSIVDSFYLCYPTLSHIDSTLSIQFCGLCLLTRESIH